MYGLHYHLLDETRATLSAEIPLRDSPPWYTSGITGKWRQNILGWNEIAGGACYELDCFGCAAEDC